MNRAHWFEQTVCPLTKEQASEPGAMRANDAEEEERDIYHGDQGRFCGAAQQWAGNGIVPKRRPIARMKPTKARP